MGEPMFVWKRSIPLKVFFPMPPSEVRRIHQDPEATCHQTRLKRRETDSDFYQKGPSWPWKPSRLLLLRLMSWKQTNIIILLNVLQDARQVSKSKVTYLVSALFSFFPQDHIAQRSEPGCEAGRTRVTQKPTTALAQSALHTGLCSHPLLVFLFSDA